MISKLWDKGPKKPTREELIRINQEQAIELIPESLIRADLLYIPIDINGTNTVALIDTGAQMTIMSKSFAEKCGLSNLIDEKYVGNAVGVGERKIIGKIWFSDMQVGIYSLPCSFAVLEDISLDILIGIDMLKTHNCTIDLHNRCLRIANHQVDFVVAELIHNKNKEQDET
jgi:DNA damage-inducible protein 1